MRYLVWSGEHIAGDASSSQLASASLELEAPVADEDVESGSGYDARQTQCKLSCYCYNVVFSSVN